MDRSPPGRGRDGERDPRLLQWADRPLQGAQVHPLCERIADDCHGEGTEVRDACGDDSLVETCRAEDRLTVSYAREHTKIGTFQLKTFSSPYENVGEMAELVTGGVKCVK